MSGTTSAAERENSGRLSLSIGVAIYLVVVGPWTVNTLADGLIAAAPATGHWLPGGMVTVRVEAWDPGHSEVEMRGCVQMDIEHSWEDQHGWEPGGRHPSSTQVCPVNSSSIVPTIVTLHLGRAANVLVLNAGTEERKFNVVVPAGHVALAAVEVDNLTASGYAAHARFTAPEPPSTLERVRDVFAALGALTLLAAVVAILVGVPGKTVAAVLAGVLVIALVSWSHWGGSSWMILGPGLLLAMRGGGPPRPRKPRDEATNRGAEKPPAHDAGSQGDDLGDVAGP